MIGPCTCSGYFAYALPWVYITFLTIVMIKNDNVVKSHKILLIKFGLYDHIHDIWKKGRFLNKITKKEEIKLKRKRKKMCGRVTESGLKLPSYFVTLSFQVKFVKTYLIFLTPFKDCHKTLGSFQVISSLLKLKCFPYPLWTLSKSFGSFQVIASLSKLVQFSLPSINTVPNRLDLFSTLSRSSPLSVQADGI